MIFAPTYGTSPYTPPRPALCRERAPGFHFQGYEGGGEAEDRGDVFREAFCDVCRETAVPPPCAAREVARFQGFRVYASAVVDEGLAVVDDH